MFDLTYNKSLYPVIYSAKKSDETILLPPQIDWFKEETTFNLHEQINTYFKSFEEAEEYIIELIKERLRPFVLEHGIIIAKGSAESGARNLKRFDLRNLGFTLSNDEISSNSNDLIDQKVLLEAAKFIYQVSKGQNVTIQRAIVSTPLTWMSQFAINNFLERQIIEHSVSVNIEKYPKDFIYGTLRVIFSSSVPDLNDLHNPSNWSPSHLISLSSLQMATNVGRQGTLEMLSPEMIHSRFKDKFIYKLCEAGKKAMSLTSIFGPKYYNEEIILDGTGKAYEKINSEEHKSCLTSEQRIPSFKSRKPNIPENDACEIPYWWPRYLMLDLIAEALFVDNEGRTINGAHIIDIISTQTNDATNQSIYLVRDRNGRVCEGKIVDFLFWLLEPNVGIGLWPNYWKREVVRCQKNNLLEDYKQIGISDRIVLNNFLKAGNEFLNFKKKTNNLFTENYDSILQENLNLTISSESIVDQSKPSLIGDSLFNSLYAISSKYGLISISANQISLWLSESLRSIVLKNDDFKDDAIEEIYEYSFKLIQSITFDDINYSIEKSIDESSSHKGSLIPSITENSQNIMNWLKDDVFIKRICEITIDSLLSKPLAPFIEISPNTYLYKNFEVLKYDKTFVIITDKTSLITHQIYPFISGKGDYPINIIGCHTSWIIKGSNLAKRAIFYSNLNHRFIESELEIPLILDFGFILELQKSGEVLRHKKLAEEYERVGMKIINDAQISKERADNKLWIRENKPAEVLTPAYIVLSHQDLEQISNNNNEDLIQKISFFLNPEKNIVVQASKNTTESEFVQYIPVNKDQAINALNLSKKINKIVNSSVLVSELRGNVLFKKSNIVLRFNVSESQISVAAYVADSPDTKIIGLSINGYCERLETVLNNLFEESSNKKVSVTYIIWNNILNTARSVAKCINLPLIGIDMVLESTDGKVNVVVLEVNARPGSLIFGEELIFDESGSFFHSSMISPVNEDFWNQITNISINRNNCFPKTLLQWKSYLSNEVVLKWHIYSSKDNLNPNSNFFISWLLKRYGSDKNLVKERIDYLMKTIDDCIMNIDSFDLNEDVSIIFSNGRNR